ncbi:MAG TPA: zinc dependent phospholipase C family protein [Bryobacteraceae bacterium]|nr:zinc dependent phospholipase C family protein [Bryobacteraceae bacterium]
MITWIRSALALSLLSICTGQVFACSVLSHEAIVDAVWEVKLAPVLRARFPQATATDLQRAHAYAYGGAIIQDLGYYPHGSKKFSDLTHYTRTGDFVAALLREAKDLDETAFAFGALSHYASDAQVHRDATNPGEAILYPSLEHKFGKVITYEDDPAAHLKTEFGFDVLEVAKGNFAPEAYHNFIGFEVATPLLERAFRDTYGIELKELFPNLNRSIGSYRRAVSRTVPEATRIAWAEREDDIEKMHPGVTRSRFVYVMSRSSYEREWGKQYDRPTALDRFAAAFLKIIPPVGPLRALRFRMPTPEVEALFMKSFDRAVAQYESELDQARAGKLWLRNINYDLGEPAKPGDYELQDEAYAFWLDKLASLNFQTVTPAIRAEILRSMTDAPIAQGEEHLAGELAALKQLRLAPAPAHARDVAGAAP